MRLIHTADWQIGKPFRNFGDREPVLRQARLAAIEAIGALAVAEGAGHVLVAGDLYDAETPAQRTLLEPMERMRRFPGIAWHVIPGNHDPHRGSGLWDRLRIAGAPDNVHLHLSPEPSLLGDAAVLLPAPLRRKSDVGDLTGWMDTVTSPAGLLRIGLAHGSVADFGVGGEASNPIAPDRAQRAGLDYLALGDWHRTVKVNAATWYAGTPEPDRHNSQELGQALLVDIAAAGAPPAVTAHPTGSYRWLSLSERLADTPDLDGLDRRLRALPQLSRTVLKLDLAGTLPVLGRTELDRRLQAIEAALFHLDVVSDGLAVRPTLADLEAIDFGGVLREAADTLKSMATDAGLGAAERRRAEEALIALFLMAGRDRAAGAAS